MELHRLLGEPELLRDLFVGWRGRGPAPRGRVVHPDANTADEARKELTFFLRAWQSRHPQVDVQLG
jgi:hypothetical protein